MVTFTHFIKNYPLVLNITRISKENLIIYTNLTTFLFEKKRLKRLRTLSKSNSGKQDFGNNN